MASRFGAMLVDSIRNFVRKVLAVDERVTGARALWGRYTLPLTNAKVLEQ